MDQQDVSPQPLAAQGLGEPDPVSGGLAPVINLSTNYEQQPDGSYQQGRVYTRADNPTSEHAERLLAALRLPTVAPSLGGVETLITQPALTSHAGMSRADRERIGVTDDLLRISCGVENADDLVADFTQALERV